MNLRTFYNDFIGALGRKTDQIKIEVHPQPDGGVVIGAIITDSEGKKSLQELHVSMKDRKKFGDTFLIEGFKADVLAAGISRFKRSSALENTHVPPLEIATSDAQFLQDLEGAHIADLKISHRLAASAEHNDMLWLDVKPTNEIAARIFGQWLYDRVTRKKPDTILVNQIDVSSHPDRIGAILERYLQQANGHIDEEQ